MNLTHVKVKKQDSYVICGAIEACNVSRVFRVLHACILSVQLECTIYVQDYSPVADPSHGTCTDESTCAHLSLVLAR